MKGRFPVKGGKDKKIAMKCYDEKENVDCW